MNNPNPNVTILSGEPAEPLPEQTQAFDWSATSTDPEYIVRRCPVCAVPILQRETTCVAHTLITREDSHVA